MSGKPGYSMDHGVTKDFPKIFERVVGASSVKERKFVLSHEDKELDLGKNAELILSPLEANINDKRFINKLYGELKELAYGETYYVQTRKMIHDVMVYFMELEQDASVPLDYAELDFGRLLKSLGVKLDDSAEEPVERLTQYLHVVAKLMNKALVVFVNLSSYLENQEIEKLLQEAFYLKLYVILIEREDIHIEIGRKCYIIDTDHCEIY